MSQDFAKRNTSGNRRHANTKPQAPAWLWFVLGALCGAFAMALFYWSHSDAPPPAAEPVKPANDAKVPKPRFDFYKLLQESETIVPATEKTPEGEKAPEQIAPNMEYVLQVGSFPNLAEAEKCRLQLQQLKLDTHIESVEIHKGEIWHRVMVGPFDSQEKLASTRSVLVANQYNALVLKRAKAH
ncbi:MAG TPA: SPOR domain-containing protein [Cellvibrio sp.]|nr:SPOR domain-containing protein [Cellvibrio sp.]